MNLSILEQMIRQGDLSLQAAYYLVHCRGEAEWLDYKEDLHLDYDKQLCDFTKDVLAMKNVGGGYIVVGVRDKTWEPIGLPSPLPYDTKLLRDQVRRCAAVEIDIDIVHHQIESDGGQPLLALILVRSSRKRSKRRVPTVAAKDFASNQPYRVRRGDIFVRRGDSTVRIGSQQELADLLANLESQADSDALLAQLSASPFAIEDGLYRLQDRGYETFVGRQALRDEIVAAVTRDPRIWIINVHGPGGVGKSALVNWATYQFYGERSFESIIQLTAKETVLTEKGIHTAASRSLYSLENLLDQIISTFEEPIPEDMETRRTLARDVLSVWSTLLVLDNMETVSDGRILRFVQELPPDTRAKVLLTSRTRSGGWELPIGVTELNEQEAQEFLRVKSKDMNVGFPLDAELCNRVREASGGLPLAMQWVIGQFKATQDISRVLDALSSPDSPVLEFSFRNIWSILSKDAQQLLAAFTIFDAQPSMQELAVATDWQPERIDRSLAELQDVTLATEVVQASDGRVTYSSLPITLSFARHQLAEMGEWEVDCRQRLQRFTEQMQLVRSETERFASIFDQYNITTDNEKRAAILCRRGESEASAGKMESAEILFKQARELAPQSAYVLAMAANFELSQGRIGAALNDAIEACSRSNRRTGALAYTAKAKILDAQRDHLGRVEALRKALECAPGDLYIRHQYGVALSRAGFSREAIDEFTRIIDSESARTPPRETLLVALRTRIVNLRRLGSLDEAEEDQRRAERILAENPHLAAQAAYFAEMD